MVKSYPSNDPHSDPPRLTFRKGHILTSACLCYYVTDRVMIILPGGDSLVRARQTMLSFLYSIVPRAHVIKYVIKPKCFMICK